MNTILQWLNSLKTTPKPKNPEDRVKQLIDELVALDYPEMTLYAVGFCPKCETAIDHWVDEPFASCECGTGEDCSGPGLIQRLRVRITEELPRPESQPVADKRIKDDKLERKTMEACSICGLHLKQEDNHNDLTCKTCDGFPMI